MSVLDDGEQNLEASAALGTLEDLDGPADGEHVVAYEGEPEAGAARDAPVVGGAPSKEPTSGSPVSGSTCTGGSAMPWRVAAERTD